jgi:flagellar basal body-associated protein FliL
MDDDSSRPSEAPRLQLVDNPPQAIRPANTVPKPRVVPSESGATGTPIPQPASGPRQDEPYDDYGTPPDYYKHKRSPIWKILGIIIVIAVLAAAAYFWFVRARPGDTVTKDNTPPTAEQKTPSAPKSQITGQTKQYSATNFTVSFEYPADWTVTEAAGSGKLLVASPALKLTDASGATKQGKVLLTIRDKQQALPEFDSGNAVAARTSEKISYTQPSSVQRGSTYISLLRFADTSATSGIDGVYITGDSGYQEAQAIPKADFASVDPIIALTFEECESATACTNTQNRIHLSASAWQDKRLHGPLTDILKSLVIM